jgi:predicted DNA-binding transcriptional regulator YafY
MQQLMETMESKLGKTFSISTIQKDIKSMREDEALGYLAPIGYSRQHDGYYYMDPNYSISIPFSEEDVTAIEFAAELLHQFRDIPIFRNYRDAIAKVMEAVSIGRDLGDGEEEIIQFEQSVGRQGSEWISQILHAIRSRKAIQFHYTKFGSDESKLYRLDPYLLKEYRNRWYVVGKRDEKDEIATFGLDRITDLHVTTQGYVPDETFSPKEFFKYAFGITTYRGKPEDVVLSFDPEEAPYLKTQPLHHSQEILVDTPREFRIRLKVYPTIELKMAIWSFGPRVKVIKPKSLRN